jgi:pilin isopeptide linkage protein
MKKHFKKSRRMLSFLLCFLMTFTMLPTMAFAEDTAPAEENTAVTADVSTSEETSSDKEVASTNETSEDKEVVNEEPATEATEESTEPAEESTETTPAEQVEEQTEENISLAMNGPGQGPGKDQGQQGGQETQKSKLNHIDVRVAATLNIVTKVNGVVKSTEKVDVSTSNVSGTLNGKAISFTRKQGTGTENEWRVSNLSLNPNTDKVVIKCTLTGKKADGNTVSVTESFTYTGSTVLNKWIKNCPTNEGYDIDITAEDISESFTVDKMVKKVWDDNNSTSRPTSVQIQLYADGVAYGTPITLTATYGWMANFKDLPRYSTGTTEIVYTAKEVNVPTGYTASYSADGLTITNKLANKDIEVQKAWVDEGWESYRPESVTVNLLADGTKVDSLTLKADDQGNWKGTFKNKPIKDANGNVIKYTVQEETAEDSNYTVSYTEPTTAKNYWTVTNTWSYESKPATVAIKAKKSMDGVAATGSSFQFQLKDSKGNVVETVKNDGEEVAFTALTFDKADTYEYTVSEVAGDNAGVNYDDTVYTVKVVVEPDGKDYKATVTYLDGDKECSALSFANTTKTKDIEVQKVWDDEGWETYRPAKVTINLLANGTTVDALTLEADAEGNWNGAFTNKPVADEDGNVINYTVEEVVAEDSDYKASYANDDDSWTVTNTWNHESEPATVNLDARKYLDGDVTDRTFDFQLKDENGNVLQTVQNKADEIIFDELTFDKEGTYEYTISEVAGTDETIEYDSTVYTAVVKVSLQGKDYVAEVVCYRDGEVWQENDGIPTFNNITKPQSGTLVISKTVSGDGADKTKEFTFKVTLLPMLNGTTTDNIAFNSDVLLTDISGTPAEKVGGELQMFGDVEFVDGVAYIKLKDGESKTITNIPAGFTYTVEELDGDGYTVTVNGKEATSVSGTIEGNAVVKAAFNNYKAADTPDEPDDEEEVTETKAPATGDNSNTILWIIVAIVAVAALCGVAYSRKHMNKH